MLRLASASRADSLATWIYPFTMAASCQLRFAAGALSTPLRSAKGAAGLRDRILRSVPSEPFSHLHKMQSTSLEHRKTRSGPHVILRSRDVHRPFQSPRFAYTAQRIYRAICEFTTFPTHRASVSPDRRRKALPALFLRFLPSLSQQERAQRCIITAC